MELLDLLRLFLQAKAAENRSRNTTDWYGYQIRAFRAWLLTQASPNILHHETIQAFLAASRDEGLKPSSVHGRYRALSAFYAWLVDSRRLDSTQNPMRLVKPPAKGKRKPRQASAEDYLSLVDSIPPTTWVDLRDRFLVHLLFLCGLRVAEAARLRVDDVDVMKGLVLVRAGKGDNDRLVPAPPALKQAFVAYLYSRPESLHPEIALSVNNGAIRGAMTGNGIRQMLRRRCKAAGVTYLNPHSFRHGLAIYLINRGADVSLVQKILGHSDIKTTMIYVDWATDGIVKNYTEAMGDIAGGK